MGETPDNDEIDDFLRAHKPIASGASFKQGDAFGDWRVTAFLGRGGSGEVYRVEHDSLGTVAALKVHIPRTGEDAASRDASAKVRFMREARFLSENAHSAFPRFFGFGEREGRPWYVMELLEPLALPSTDKSVARFMLGVAAGVGKLHSMGLVHRDIKPGNIMQRPGTADDGATPVLIDMGLVKTATAAQDLAGDALSIVDGKAVALGTPRYAAPEQLNGGEITPATDIYALGMLANECFVGRPPFAWARIIRRATASIPAHRYATVADLAGAIRCRNLLRNVAIGGAIGLICIGIAVTGTLLVSSPSEKAFKAFPSYGKWSKIATSTVSNGITYTTINLNSSECEIEERLELKGPQVLSIHGPGRLVASVSGSSNVSIRLIDGQFRNKTKIQYPQNAIRYVLEGEKPDLVFESMYYPTNCVKGATKIFPAAAGGLWPADTSPAFWR